MEHLLSVAKTIIYGLITLFILQLYACGKKGEATPVTTTKNDTVVKVTDTFAHYTAIQPIMNKYCIGCHGQGYAYPFETYKELKSQSDAGNLNDRLFVKKDMPPAGNTKPSAAELKLIKKWIVDGCKE
ncbi:MAG: hypothetical protein PSX81_11605 [bacterium]|nr:hypothetical protein [bacterium]